MDIQKYFFNSRINLRMIRCFLVVAQELHFGKAAERLNLSQPPLSLQIKELEEILGFRLFIRDSRNVALTRAGKIMQVEMEQITQSFENSLNRVCQIGRNELQHLNIGMIGSALWYCMLDTLNLYKQEYPEITWSLHELYPALQQAALLHKKIDIGFWRCANIDLDSSLQAQCIESQKIVLAVSYNNHLSCHDIISLEDLSGQNFIFMSLKNSHFSKNLYESCLKACTPKEIHQFEEQQTQMVFVGNNLGIALVPESTQEIPWPNIKFIPLKEHLSADLFAVYNPNNLSAASLNLLNLFKK